MNYSIINTTSVPSQGHDVPSRVQVVVQATTMAGIIFSSIFGNILILLAVWTNQHLQCVTSVFIVNLACADLLLAITGMPFTLVSSITFDWIFGEELCKLHGAINFVFAIASILSLTMVAIERYVAIIKPLKYLSIMTHKTAVVMIAYVWFHSILGSLLPIMGWSRYTYIRMESLCTVDWTNSISNTVFVIMVCFFIPVTIVVYCYFHILTVAQDHSKRIQPNLGELSLEISAEQAHGVAVQAQREKDTRKKAEKKYKQEAKAAKTLLLVIGTFMLCWSPHIVGIVTLLIPSTNLPKEFFALTTWLAMLNSACNPIIYGVLNRRFRESFKRVLCFRKINNQIMSFHRKNHSLQRENTNALNGPQKTRSTTF